MVTIYEVAKYFIKCANSRRDVLDQVWERYGRLDVKVLEALTNGEDPWKKARMLLENDPYSPAIIVKDDMMSFYRGKIKEE